jgi:hypothetical protein
LTPCASPTKVRRMSNDRLSGLALIAGSIGMIITMALHPSGHVPAADMAPMIRKIIAVHGLALACLPILFLGTLGLSRRIACDNHLALIAVVIYAFGLFAIMNAGVANGLVFPAVLRRIADSAGSPQAIEAWQMIARYNFYVNQAYAQVFVAASSVAVFLWSASIWRSRELSRGLGMYGCLLGPVTLGALFSGHLNLDAHGFGIVVLGQAIWFMVAGKLLWRLQELPLPAAALR